MQPVIQTRHRIPETPLTEDQIIIFQVPIPEPLRFIEPRETENPHHARAGGIRRDAGEAV
ncbi:PhnJ protein [Escherichia coli]|nr:PhnJ protein [Escherichia coli]